MKITEQTYKNLPITGKDEWYPDDTLKGFGIRQSKKGICTFYIRTTDINGNRVQYKIGQCGSINASAARAP